MTLMLMFKIKMVTEHIPKPLGRKHLIRTQKNKVICSSWREEPELPFFLLGSQIFCISSSSSICVSRVYSVKYVSFIL